MAHNVGLRPLLLSTCTLLVTVACSGSDGSSGKSLLDSCSGPYICVIDGEVTDSGLMKAGGRCYLGQIELDSDGTSPPTNGHFYRWSGDASRLDICEEASCFSCYPSAAPAASSSNTPPATGNCVGSADSCSEVGAASCSDQRGCIYTVGATSSLSDDGCTGSEAPCSDFKNDSDGCNAQQGCSWQ
jgi:hypothetical protein